MTERRLRVVLTEDVEPERWAEISALCETAFQEPPEALWNHLGQGVHVTVYVGSRLVAHAMLVDRVLWIGRDGGVPLDVGYVENVATLPDEQGRGHATAAMEAVARIIRDEYAIGALVTGSNAFYARLGWETWRGPTSVRMSDGEGIRSADEDGHVMILRTPRTPPDLDLDGPISVQWREVQSW
jgi:aminoglycoside 2'-N-acetyltransferase I